MHVKICCIASVDEAQAAIAAGASALGLVSATELAPLRAFFAALA